MTAKPDFIYRTDVEAPPVGLEWIDYTGTAIDFSVGWTFTAQLVNYSGVVAHTVSAGISGGATVPNVVIDWPVGTFSALAPGRYMMVVKATEQASNKERLFSPDRWPTIEILAAPTP